MRKRVICLCVVLSLLITSLSGRVLYIILSNEYQVSKGYNSYVLTLEKLYPTVYYLNGEKITNNAEKYYAVLKPNTRTITDIHNLFPASEIHSITNELKQGRPIIKEIDENKAKNAKYIQEFSATGSEYISKQLFSASSSGLMKYVKPYGERKMRFSTDALGRMLAGSEGEEYYEYFSSIRGINTTINSDVEQIANGAAEAIKSGCVVIMDVRTSSILACITKPDKSYINKAFEQYSVGSVFKIIVALCALENNIDFYYSCTGKTEVGDSVYSCQNNNKHSFQNMQSALANSCNCYFVNLALKLGKDKLLETAQKLGFDEDIVLYNDWKVKHSNLPSENELNSKGQLALFGFGQGKLTVTPLHMCYTLCTIANEGKKNQVHFTNSIIYDNNQTKEYLYQNEKQVFDEDNCKEIINSLRYVVTNGTGKNAEDTKGKSSGKTATAQTGQYINGTELLNTWFAGVYPYDNPKYAIVVMCEQGRSGSEDCAPVFRQIVEKLNKL